MRVFLNNQLIDNVLQATLNISLRTNFERSMSISLYDVSQTFIQDGDEIEIFEDDGTTKLFGGIINSYSSQFITSHLDAVPLFQTDISSEGYAVIAQRRVVSASYTNTNVRTMVLAMLNSNNLGAETILQGTIAAAADLPTIDYSASFKTIHEVLDELADASGHIWYIDNSRRLHFIEQQGVTNAPYSINTFNGTFKDFNSLSWAGSTDNYCNKVFVVGDGVSVALESTAEIADRATEAGGQGTGVYGFVIEDTNIKSQFQANTVGNAHLRNYANSPSTVSFSTYTKGFAPGQKLQVRVSQITGFDLNPPNLPNIWYYLIEEVSMELEAGGIVKYNISATRRNNGNFSTQKSAGFQDYFKKLIKKG